MTVETPIDFDNARARARARTESDDLRALEVGFLKREGFLEDNEALEHEVDVDVDRYRRVEWSDGSSILVAGSREKVRLLYTVRAGDEDPDVAVQLVRLDWTTCNFGGTRPWFGCPSCNRRVGKLFGAYRFECRHCVGMVYSSTLESKPFRMMRRAQDLRRRCGGDMNLSRPFPPRPKGMPSATYERCRSESEWLAHASLVAAVETWYPNALARLGQ